jgi:serine/threonine protein phosphatase PrpC
MRLRACGKTHVGMRRKVNQDAFLIDEELGFFIVADGMGGHAGGEIASQETVDAVHDMIVRNRGQIEDFAGKPISQESSHAICRLLESSVQSATYMVYGMAEQSPAHQGMGTTVSAMLIAGAFAITAQVGDSRIYCVRDGETLQLTEDHTLVNWQIREGVITREQAEHAPYKNIITRAVGSKDYVDVDTQILSVRVNDQFLLCSDGLHGYLERDEISEIFAGDFDAICGRMIDLANDRGGKDNITSVAVTILDD